MIGIIDLQIGNLFSITKLLKNINKKYVIFNSQHDLEEFELIILPGVGSFPRAADNLGANNLNDKVTAFAKSGRGVIGICLGMQLLLDSSNEFGVTKGLGLIPGKVIRIPESSLQRVPNVGWRTVSCTNRLYNKHMNEIIDNQDFYFAHSYYCVPKDNNCILATINSGKDKIPVIVSNGHNVFGVQFHPELSDLRGELFFSSLIEKMKKLGAK